MSSCLVAPAADVTFRMCVPESNDPNVRAIRSGEYPVTLRPLFSLLRTIAPRSAQVLDLGAYLGGFGLAAAAAGHEVVMVEANSDNAQWIRRSIEQNTFPRSVTLIESAVGESDGQVNFAPNGPYGHVQLNGKPAEGAVVRMMTLPTLLASIGWASPDFIKMDVEGSEGGVLRGAEPWFVAGHRPTIVYEANGHTLNWFGDSPVTLQRLLAARGYYQYELEEDGALRMPSRFEPRVLVDYVASATRLPGVLPARSPWKVMRRTVAALRRNSKLARLHVLRAVRDALTGGIAGR
jgi:FkbM family methyltransferase